ncbi:MAG: FtsX-like permease family protein, partial [Acidobacteriaceae bacterium]|nr:FtsX-like permease family protein [Acidobacteriaceae bacterium]
TDVGNPVDVFVPLAMTKAAMPIWGHMNDRLAIWLHLLGRRQPGVALKQAESAIQVIYRQEQREDLKANTESNDKFRERYLKNAFWLSTAAKGVSTVRDQFSKPLIVLMAMVGTLLLIACGNVANLLVARAAARQREIAIRLSLGASKRAVIRLVLLESVVLSFLGAALGLLVAWWSGSLLLRLLPFEGAANAIAVTPDKRVLLFTLGISLVTALVFGALPAMQAANPDVAPVLKAEATAVVGGRSVLLRKGLVAAQISLSLLLLVGTGLFARSLRNLMAVNPGVSTRHILTFSLDPSLSGYSSERTREAEHALLERISNLPGVEAASGASTPILSRDGEMRTTRVEGYETKERENVNLTVEHVLPGFFGTLRLPQVAGRDFGDRDGVNAPKVAIVNQEFVRYFFGGRNVLGRHIGFGHPRRAKLEMEIVGVVGNMKVSDLKEKTPRIVFLPEMQEPNPSSFTFYVRSVGDPTAVQAAVQTAVHQFDPRLPIFSVKTLDTQVNETHYIERLTFALSAAFGFLATALAAFGLYGVMSFAVSRRTREIGIRMALGAASRTVLGMVMSEVLVLTALGVAAALPLAFALGKLIENQLFGVKASDFSTMFAASAFLMAIGSVAGLIPARYASQIDPLDALRWE